MKAVFRQVAVNFFTRTPRKGFARTVYRPHQKSGLTSKILLRDGCGQLSFP